MMPTKQNDAVRVMARKIYNAAIGSRDLAEKRIEELLTPLLEATEALKELIELQDRLLVCYRTNSRPSGATLDRLRVVRAELARLRGE